MIKADWIEIENFRGIKRLRLELGNESFAVQGSNGTGKSGVVDALEFVLTGAITRLSGTGSGDVSLKQHAPHVDSRDALDNSHVKLKIWIPQLKKSAVLQRKLSNPKTVTVRSERGRHS